MRTIPMGADRDDMRAAANTAKLLWALLPEFSEDQEKHAAALLRNYLEINQPKSDRTLTPEEAAAIKAAEGKSRG